MAKRKQEDEGTVTKNLLFQIDGYVQIEDVMIGEDGDFETEEDAVDQYVDSIKDDLESVANFSRDVRYIPGKQMKVKKNTVVDIVDN